MGRYAEPLAEVFVAFAGVGVGDKVLDVGCGPGALTTHLLSVGAEVAAIDPSPPFVDAIRVRCPDVDVRRGTAEQLPYDTATFDAALAQLVVHLMTDPVAGIRRMARVTRRGGVIAACVWDGPTGALAPFWDAVHVVHPEVEDEALLSGARMGHLTELFDAAGLLDVLGGFLASLARETGVGPPNSGMKIRRADIGEWDEQARPLRHGLDVRRL